MPSCVTAIRDMDFGQTKLDINSKAPCHIMHTIRLGILISGRGSNMKAIVDAVRTGIIPADIGVVISNRADADGLESAKAAGIPVEVAISKGFAGGRAAYDTAIMDLLRRYGVTPESGLVCLAGFMRILSAKFIDTYPNRIMNIHPSLLPSFGGLDAQKQATRHGVKCSGCTVHFADAGVDTGPIICQTPVPVYHTDTDKTLAARILEKEHQTYVRAVRLFAQGRLKVVGRIVHILDA